MPIPFVDRIDFNKIWGLNFVSENRVAAPSSPVPGQRYFDTALGKEGVWNGSAWDYAGSGGVATIAVTAPLTSTGGNNPTLGITPASSLTAGSMSISDFVKLGAATSANTANTIVMRDGAGNFAGTASNAAALGGATPASYLDRANHTGTQSTATISGFDAQVRTSRLDQMAAPTSAVGFGGQRVTNVATPTAGSDAVNLDTLNAAIATGTNKGNARVAATTNINIAAPGASIDGVALANGEIVLLTAQTTASANGLYVFNGAAVAMTRTTNADTSAEVQPGLFVFVSEGTTNASNGFTLVTPSPIVLGITALNFTQTSGAGQINAGTGLTKTGNILNVGQGTGITVNADDIAINTAVVVRKFTQQIGDGASTSITVTHGLANATPTWSMFVTATGLPVVPGVGPFAANTSTFVFAVAPSANQYTVQIQG